ncbi:MAG TPA: glycoside hydrolase family 38 C-terminal domain-containing protein [Armatimonadota bacterium]|jgi:alpha-mannosidase
MRIVIPLVVMALVSGTAASADTVMMMAGTELAKGGASMVYYNLSNQRVTFAAGDRLEYDLFISPDSAEISGGVDAELDQGLPLRDRKITDQNGFDLHPKTVITPARGQWRHRVFPLDSVAGCTTTKWSIVFEGDEPGPYAFFAGSVGVHHADGTWTWVYQSGALPVGAGIQGISGYSQKVVVRPVERSLITPEADIKAVVADQVAAYDREGQAREVAHDIQLVASLAALTPDGAKFKQPIDEARGAIDEIETGSPLSPDGVNARLARAKASLARTRPLMKRFTGHLVGHGHIDPAWQWEWPEIYDVCNKTFSQAVRFMDEFPGFKYSQSSSSLYRIVQEHYPDVFKRMQQKVKSGQWDIVGGRVSEGDTWMISEESHARNFLLAQRYFRKWFGKTATVGFEPDTFGHTWSMPQMLKMGGIENYYFGRGGQGKPFFWWEGPDGTRALTFDEIASGSWYDSNLSGKILDELVPWKQATGTTDIMWVYGVGNHGGGPTREQLNIAETWKKTPYYPTVEYSTAQAFFDAERKQDLTALPVVKTSLDPRIDGCYTTHSEMKRLNRDAENATATAETAASIAGLFGQPYLKDRFDEAWWGITFNQHHDSLPGSGTHQVYRQSVEQLSAIVAESRNIAGASVRFLASLATCPPDSDLAVMAFNPLGWQHSGEVRFPWPRPVRGEWVAVSPAGALSLISLQTGERRDNPSGEPMASFIAHNVPGFGYSVYEIRPLNPSASNCGIVQVKDEAETLTLDNGLRSVVIRKDNGLITSLKDLPYNRETLAPGGAANRFEVWYEDPSGDAWVVGKYTAHEVLDGPATVKVLTSDHARCLVEVTRQYRHSTIIQHIVLNAGSEQVELPMWIDWQEEGTHEASTPFLKLACDVAGSDPVFRYEIPFATEEHPSDGREAAVLKSGDLSSAEGGITLLNDCKHGYSATGNTLRLSLIRTPNRLDSTSDMRAHFVQAALVTHAGAYGAEQVKRGYEFNQPFVSATVAPSASGRFPLQKSFLKVDGEGVVATVLKRAEDDPKGILVRLYEADGKAGKATVGSDADFTSTQWVNFIEDPLGSRQSGSSATADLRRFEIRNLVLRAR